MRRAKRERARRRRHKIEFVGTCSNCRKKNQLVRLIAGGQVCFSCAKKLPGHLLRKVFPMVRDAGLTKFLQDHNVVGTTAVDRPGESELAAAPLDRRGVQRRIAEGWKWLKRKIGFAFDRRMGDRRG